MHARAEIEHHTEMMIALARRANVGIPILGTTEFRMPIVAATRSLTEDATQRRHVTSLRRCQGLRGQDQCRVVASQLLVRANGSDGHQSAYGDSGIRTNGVGKTVDADDVDQRALGDTAPQAFLKVRATRSVLAGGGKRFSDRCRGQMPAVN